MVKLKWFKNRDGELQTQDFVINQKILTKLLKRRVLRSKTHYHQITDSRIKAHFRLIRFASGDNLRLYDSNDSLICVIRPYHDDIGTAFYSSKDGAKQAAQRLVD